MRKSTDGTASWHGKQGHGRGRGPQSMRGERGQYDGNTFADQDFDSRHLHPDGVHFVAGCDVALVAQSLLPPPPCPYEDKVLKGRFIQKTVMFMSCPCFMLVAPVFCCSLCPSDRSEGTVCNVFCVTH